MPDETPSKPPETGAFAPDRLATFRWPLVVVLLGLFLLIAFIVSLNKSKQVYVDAMDRAGRAADGMKKAVVDIASKFQRGTITETFTAAIPLIKGTGMGNLELATAETTESFEKSDMKTIGWDLLYIGMTSSEIKVPVTYRYHLKLSDPWKLDVTGQTCVVIAPPIRPSLPPAIHTDRMEKKSDRGWARLNADQQMTELEQSITPTLQRYAADPRHIRLVREECRKTVAEFVKMWLLKEDHWRTNRFNTIKVIFADEVERTEVKDAPPTITILP